jgi:hypothetical protein
MLLSFQLHNALTHIATITKYNRQRWLKNLKELYIKNCGNKQVLDVILHISTARLLDLIEESARKGLQDSYQRYIEDNQKEVERSKDELIFLYKVMNEIERTGK